MNIYMDLFLTFAKCSAVTFGGGYAVLPILQREIVEGKKWAAEEELMDYYAVSQVTPGMIAVNVATFVGLQLRGFWGGFCATLGTITPSILIISIIALFLSQLEDNPLVLHAFAGIRACVVILILDAVWKLGKKSVKDKGSLFIFLLILLLALFAPFSPVISVFIAAAMGYMLKPLIQRKGDRK